MNTNLLTLIIFLSICFFILFLTNREDFIIYSNTVLGKFIGILIICTYAKIHIGLGLLLTFVVLSYYKIYGYDSWNIYQGTEFLDGVDTIYWINLERSTDRKAKMELIFSDKVFYGKNIQRINAIDGKSDAVYDKLVLKNKKNTKLEYACLLSHLKAIRTFSETFYGTALIFEDDITLEFKKYWRKSIRDIIANAPEDWEIIQLCYNTTSTLKEDYTLNNYQRNRYGSIACIAAYIINNNAAKKLMNEIYDPVTEKYKLIDYHTHEADHYLFKCMKTYTYKYPYFIYPTDNTSTLHPEDLTSHIRSKIRLQNMYNYMSR
jgi:GR25 family glycosyltransferase involved in LPS biosynthesis